MTYLYEIRSFNCKGECFAVREYDSKEIAQSKFNFFVSNTKTGHKRLLENNIQPIMLAYEMQLVKRDDNYIGLVELANWKVVGA
jgi:hypothetical protein